MTGMLKGTAGSPVPSGSLREPGSQVLLGPEPQLREGERADLGPHLAQDLVQGAEQGQAQAAELVQVGVVLGAVPEVGAGRPRYAARPAGEAARRVADCPGGTEGPAQALPKEGGQGTWGLAPQAARAREGAVVAGRSPGSVRGYHSLGLLSENQSKNTNGHNFGHLKQSPMNSQFLLSNGQFPLRDDVFL